jgi:hypothetical protein
MNRSKIIAIITGALSILLAIAYLLLVQLLDFRGEMRPAPVSQISQPATDSLQPILWQTAGKPNQLNLDQPNIESANVLPFAAPHVDSP